MAEMSLLPELNIEDAFRDRPSFRKALDIWGRTTDKLGESVASVAEAVKTVRASGASHKNTMLEFSTALETASDNFVLEDEEIKEPLMEFSKALKELETARDTLLSQTNRLTSGSVEDIATQFAQTRQLKSMLQDTNVKQLSSMTKLSQMKIEADGVEDYLRRAEKTFNGRTKAQGFAAAYAERVRHLVLVDKLDFLQKILEYMKTLQEFYQDGAKIMSTMEPYMISLTDSLSLYKRAAEDSHEQDRVAREQLKNNLNSLYEEECHVLNSTEFDKGTGGKVASSMAKNAWKRVNKLASSATQGARTSRSPNRRKKKSALGSPKPSGGGRSSSPSTRSRSPLPTDEHRMSMMMPDLTKKEGYMFRRVKKQWRLEYFVIVDNHLATLDENDNPQKLANFLLSTLRPCDGDRLHCFEVITPGDKIMLQPLGPRDHELWTMAIHAGIADALETGNADGGDAKVRIDPVTTLAPIPGNDKCADCAAADTEWASINLGILLCIGCSGAHRSVGVHISKVRSLTLDRWTPETLDFMVSVGNEKANKFYEANITDDVPRISLSSTKEERIAFVTRKYVDREFVDKDESNGNFTRQSTDSSNLLVPSDGTSLDVSDLLADTVEVPLDESCDDGLDSGEDEEDGEVVSVPARWLSRGTGRRVKPKRRESKVLDAAGQPGFDSEISDDDVGKSLDDMLGIFSELRNQGQTFSGSQRGSSSTFGISDPSAGTIEHINKPVHANPAPTEPVSSRKKEDFIRRDVEYFDDAESTMV